MVESEDAVVKFQTLQVSNLPKSTLNNELEDVFSDFGPIKRCFVVKNKTVGYVEFALSDDCLRALNTSLSLNENDLKLKLAGPKKSNQTDSKIADKSSNIPLNELAKQRKSRLIIRNLSFKASNESLMEFCSAFGSVKEINILLQKDGRMVGCAFVQYSNVSEASKAIKNGNGKIFLGRPVAIDWAVCKDRYQNAHKDSILITSACNNEESILDKDDGEIKNEDDTKSNEDEDTDNSLTDSNEDNLDMNRRDRLPVGHDVDEGRTVFLRNLSFSTEEEDLKEMLCERIGGEILFVKLVLDKETQHPRGTAFVKFVKKEDAEKCVQISQELDQSRLFFDGRQIYATIAVTKESADQMSYEKKEKVAKDKRNLHLAREGLVRAGTKAAEGVSESDMARRVEIEKWKKTVLKNLNMIISRNRLCLRNLPPIQVNCDKDLRKLVGKYCEKEDKITEAKLICTGAGGVGPSKGFGFVSFSTHESALKFLRKVNNNPTVFGPKKRPIIEFSVENRVALLARAKRLQKSREMNPNYKLKSTRMSTNDSLISTRQGHEKSELDFRTEFMGSISHRNQRNLPSHVGPKIRTNRPKASKPVEKKKQKKISRKDIRKRKLNQINGKLKRKMYPNEMDGSRSNEKKIKISRKERNQSNLKKKKNSMEKKEKEFSLLVKQYKQKLIQHTGGDINETRKKWFN